MEDVRNNQPQEPETATGQNAGQVETAGTQNEAGKVEAGAVENTDKVETKSFTQAEVDELIKQRIERERKKFEKTNPQTEVEQLKAELHKYKTDAELSKVNVEDEFKEYVAYKVNEKVGDEKDFATALKEFFEIESNKKYLKSASKPINMPRPENIGTPTSDHINAKYGDVKPLNRGRI